jgi:hypothetical protein
LLPCTVAMHCARSPLASHVRAYQGDQIGQIFAHWVMILFFRHFSWKIHK